MVVVDGQGIPLGSTLASASPAEVTLAEETLETVKVPRKGRGRPKKRPLRLIGDKGYDSDPLRKRLKAMNDPAASCRVSELAYSNNLNCLREVSG